MLRTSHLVVDNKLFQALNYCMLGDDSLSFQIINSLKRQLADHEAEFESTKVWDQQRQVYDWVESDYEYLKRLNLLEDWELQKMK